MKSRGAQCAAFWALYAVSALLTYGLLGIVVVGTTLLVMPERLGHRRRDVFGLIVPILGLIWNVRLLWRLTHLSSPYWSMRDGSQRAVVEPRMSERIDAHPPDPQHAGDAPRYCSQCGSGLGSDARFCPGCGRALQASQAAESLSLPS
jgi:hypothetical protein